uniref:Uncharacterized protein n=1 Tax=Arundo donax TaxID=35708 RepID=A0A0A9CDA5_ARUDO
MRRCYAPLAVPATTSIAVADPSW